MAVTELCDGDDCCYGQPDPTDGGISCEIPSRRLNFQQANIHENPIEGYGGDVISKLTLASGFYQNISISGSTPVNDHRTCSCNFCSNIYSCSSTPIYSWQRQKQFQIKNVTNGHIVRQVSQKKTSASVDVLYRICYWDPVESTPNVPCVDCCCVTLPGRQSCTNSAGALLGFDETSGGLTVTTQNPS